MNIFKVDFNKKLIFNCSLRFYNYDKDVLVVCILEKECSLESYLAKAKCKILNTIKFSKYIYTYIYHISKKILCGFTVDLRKQYIT